MRVLPMTAVAIVLATPSVTEAQVSDDLVFCSKLSDKAERIACYDAAARIAATKRAAVVARSTPPALAPQNTAAAYANSAALVLPATRRAAEIAPFSGPYVAAGVGGAIAEPTSVVALGNLHNLVHREQLRGWSGLAAVGYNLQTGHFVVGLEASGRFGEETDRLMSQVRTDFGGVFGRETIQHSMTVDGSLHLSGRIGAAFDATLIYAQLGVGMAHVNEISRVVGEGAECEFTVGGVCGRLSPIPSSGTHVVEWQPSVLVGLGIEHNFGNWFGRVTGQAEAVRGTANFDEFFWTVRAGALIGYRF